MHNFFLLMKIRLDEMMGLSKTKSEKKLSKKLGSYVHKLILLGIVAVAFWALYELADFMGGLGLASILPSTSYIFALIVTFLVVLLKLNETFSGNEDSEFLLSTPIGTFNQVITMFIIMYVRNLIYATVIELPFYLVYMKYDGSGCSFGAWLIGLLFTGLPICGIATMVGMVLILSLMHLPKKNQIMSCVSLFFMAVAIVILVFVIDRIYLVAGGQVQIDSASMNAEIIKELTRNIKFARFYQHGIVEGQPEYVLLFVFLSSIWYIVLLFMHTMAYQTAITALRSPITYGEKSEEEILKMLKEKKTKFAVFKKELAFFLGSKSYLTHSMIGILLGIIVPLNFLIIGTEPFQMYGEKIPFLICLFAGLSCTTYCALSMEGRRAWILQTSPSSGKSLRLAKVMVNLIFSIPMTVFAGVICSIAFESSAIGWIINIVAPVVYCILISFYGIAIDSKFVDYSSESEELVLNRGTTFMLGYLPAIVLPVLGFLL